MGEGYALRTGEGIEAREVRLLTPRGRSPFGVRIRRGLCLSEDRMEEDCALLVRYLRWVEDAGMAVLVPVEASVTAPAQEVASVISAIHMGFAGLPLGMVRYLCPSLHMAEALILMGFRAYLHERVWVPGYPLWVELRAPKEVEGAPSVFWERPEEDGAWELADRGVEVLLTSEEWFPLGEVNWWR